ncbi:MAG: serine acetyltransferase [Bacteroidales bacterium]|nr:serine acetyltransferase [Bacteroidales bacterium]
MPNKIKNNSIEEIAYLLSQSSVAQSLIYQHPLRHPLPDRNVLHDIVQILRQCLFPGFFGESPTHVSWKSKIETLLDQAIELIQEQIYRGLCLDCSELNHSSCKQCRTSSKELAFRFIQSLPHIQEMLSKDVDAIYKGDPASKSTKEVILCYPGILAITNYRIAHELYKLNVPVIPRMITEFAHSETGIDIHPGAHIGEYFAIDHGTGIVIGETCVIGNHVKIYQGVTLGAKSFPLDENGNPIKGIPRHPIVEDHVIIYAEATILGRVTIGHHSIIGANQWITTDIAPYTKLSINI